MRLAAVTFLTLVLLPSVGLACDPVGDERARRAEREHRPGEAIRVRAALLACASGSEARDNALALADDYAAVGDFERSAELIEGAPTPDHARLERAVEYRLALGDLARAQTDARTLLDAGLTEPAFAVGAALEADRQWTNASQWYDALARRFPGREQWAVQAGALAGLGRAYAALGDLRSAARSWEAIVARWPVARSALGLVEPYEPPLPIEPAPEPARRLRRGRHRRLPRYSTGVVSVHGRTTESGVDDTSSVVQVYDQSIVTGPLRHFAEARFRLGRLAAEPCFGPIVYGPTPATRREFDRWTETTLTPMLRHRLWCLDHASWLLIRAVNLHVPQWELAANAVLSHLYLAFAQSIRRGPRPPDIHPEANLLEASRLVI